MSKTYKTAEACRVLDVQPYVLRYWETEFPVLGGKKPGPQRVYSEDEIGILQRIKRLLYDEGYTIAGAKKRLAVEVLDTEEENGKPAQTSKQSGSGARKSAKSKPKKGQPAAQSGKPAGVLQKGSLRASKDALESLDRQDLRSIESVRTELQKLHTEAIEILALVRAGKGR